MEKDRKVGQLGCRSCFWGGETVSTVDTAAWDLWGWLVVKRLEGRKWSGSVKEHGNVKASVGSMAAEAR